MLLRKYLFQSLGEIPKTQESLTPGKTIPTGRMKPNASPQVRKVSPEFVNFKTTSLEDEKSSDTNNKILKLCLDDMIGHPDSEKYSNVLQFLEDEKMNLEKQDSHPLLKEEIPAKRKKKFTRRAMKQKAFKLFKSFELDLKKAKDLKNYKSPIWLNKKYMPVIDDLSEYQQNWLDIQKKAVDISNRYYFNAGAVVLGNQFDPHVIWATFTLFYVHNSTVAFWG